MTRNALIVGDSHIQALKLALKRDPLRADIDLRIRAYRYAKNKDGRPIGDLGEPQIIELIARSRDHDLVVSCIGGNQHQMIALIQHPQPFDVTLPGEPDIHVEPGSVLVPYQQIRALLDSGIRGRDGERLRQIREAARGKVYHLLPPPPKEDVAHVLANHETPFARAGIVERGVTPAGIRLKIWKIQSDVLAALARELNIILLPPPAAALTSTGFLAPDYYADDATHANHGYGSLVIEQIMRLAMTAEKKT